MLAAAFEGAVAAAIARHSLLEPGRPVIVAVSGGADSVALLVALTALGYDCIAAHCNFHLRGAESQRDMQSVQQLCSRLKVDLYVRDFNVSARQKQTGESVEMACRSLRYDWFANLLDQHRAHAIAVAHHREDNIETLFLNMLRGTGLTGLAAMRPRNGYVVRPLLHLSRPDIELYLSAKGIPFVNDSTNAENEYSRNRIRNVVIPALVSAFPDAESGILSTLSCLSDNRALYAEAVANLREQYLQDKTILLASLMKEHPSTAQIILYEIIRPYGFNMSQAAEMIASASRTGACWTAGDTSISLHQGALLLTSASALTPTKNEWHVSLSRDILAPLHITIEQLPVARFKPERNPAMAYFDTDILNSQIVLRHWRKGDRISVYGSGASKLVSDVFAENKLSAIQKANAWLMAEGDKVLWVIGLRNSCHYAVGPATHQFLRLKATL